MTTTRTRRPGHSPTTLTTLATVALSLALGPLAAACGGPAGPSVESSHDAEAEFGRYRIWAVAGREALPDGFGRVELGVMELEQLRDIAREVLETKGYREGTINNADLIFFAGLGQRVGYRVEHATASYRDPDGVYEAEVSRDETVGPTDEVLVLDGFETPSMVHVFQGRATVEHVTDSYEAAEQALRALLEEVPATDPNAEPRTSGGEEAPLDEAAADDGASADDSAADDGASDHGAAADDAAAAE